MTFTEEELQLLSNVIAEAPHKYAVHALNLIARKRHEEQTALPENPAPLV
ncbi:MAG: hypothetical protein AB3X44_16070 [Leptothrix sp. (in: b-proteobacteria)]